MRSCPFCSGSLTGEHEQVYTSASHLHPQRAAAVVSLENRSALISIDFCPVSASDGGGGALISSTFCQGNWHTSKSYRLRCDSATSASNQISMINPCPIDTSDGGGGALISSTFCQGNWHTSKSYRLRCDSAKRAH